MKIGQIHSGNFGNSRQFIIRTPACFGSRGSWVRIPPRRPYLTHSNLSEIHDYYTCSNGYPHVCFLLNFPGLAKRVFGKSSGKRTSFAAAKLSEIAGRTGPRFIHFTGRAPEINQQNQWGLGKEKDQS